jgi:hypothetical protein
LTKELLEPLSRLEVIELWPMRFDTDVCFARQHQTAELSAPLSLLESRSVPETLPPLTSTTIPTQGMSTTDVELLVP